MPALPAFQRRAVMRASIEGMGPSMRTSIKTKLIALILGVMAGTAGAQSHTGHTGHTGHMMMKAPGIDPGKALDPQLGPLHHPVSTQNKQAQAFFDQGLKLAYGFNHEGAIAAFRHAAELDPQLAMAYWGMAYAMGPNYNAPMSPEAHAQAWRTLQQAITLKPHASAEEGEYIDALAKRYSDNAQADTAPLSQAYADAMKALAGRHPNDADAAVLYAESLMDLRPWRLWADGKPEQGTLEITRVIDAALALEPMHVGANHFCIHAWEMSDTPERALPCAKRLERMHLSAGHLAHMPAHIYIRTGDYLAAARSNEDAARADEALIASGVHSLYTVGYYGHNLHFLAISYGFAGRSAQAIAAAQKLAEVVKPQLKDVPYLDIFYATPAQILVMFERWDEILALEEPIFEAPISGEMFHFARALAFAAKGQMHEAGVERAKFLEMAQATGQSADWGNNKALDVLAVARPYLDGRIAMFGGDATTAAARLKEAGAAEDKLAYDEPPNWYLASYLYLGQALLKSGEAAGAEAAFRADLKHNILSGRSLHGLRLALAAQGRKADATAVGRQLSRAWRGADMTLK